jgi:predicted transcriptional regulator
MASTKPMTISLPSDLLRETQRLATEEATTPAKLVELALRQYLTSRRWQWLRRWGSDTAKQLGLKSEDDLERFLRRTRARARRKRQ